MTENDFAAPRAGRLRYWNYVAVYGLLAAIVLYPIAVVNIPGLEDYPNHLARMYILSHFKSSPDLQRFYQVRWQPIPYVGMDAAFLLLNRIAPVYDAGRILIGFCVLLPVAAVATLHYSIHRRVSLVPAAAFLLSYNALLRWGFLSYLSTLCLAVMVFAGWIATTNWSRWRRLIVFALLATALYLGHLVAFAAYCLLVLCFELSRAAKAGFQERGAILADWVFAALQAAPAIVLASSITVSDRLVGPPLTEYGTFQDKVRGILSPILFQLSKVEIVTGLVLLVVIIFARITGRVRFLTVAFRYCRYCRGFVVLYSGPLARRFRHGFPIAFAGFDVAVVGHLDDHASYPSLSEFDIMPYFIIDSGSLRGDLARTARS